MPENDPLPGLNVLLMGPAGTGKTYSIGTLVDTGIDVFYLAFESGVESLYGFWTDVGKPVPPNLHVHKILGDTASWTEQAEVAKYVRTLDFETLKKTRDPNRSKYDQYERFLRTFNDVPDDRSGTKFGNVSTWGRDRAVVIDGLTGLSNAAIRVAIGGKADRDQKDWGLGQNMLENLLLRLCNDCPCHFILLSHVDRETDVVMGGSKITVSTLGRAMAPKIPPMFSDVILTTRLGKNFVWDTENSGAEVKSRNLPIDSKNVPSFAPILAKWKSRGGVCDKTKGT